MQNISRIAKNGGRCNLSKHILLPVAAILCVWFHALPRLLFFLVKSRLLWTRGSSEPRLQGLPCPSLSCCLELLTSRSSSHCGCRTTRYPTWDNTGERLFDSRVDVGIGADGILHTCLYLVRNPPAPCLGALLHSRFV